MKGCKQGEAHAVYIPAFSLPSSVTLGASYSDLFLTVCKTGLRTVPDL